MVMPEAYSPFKLSKVEAEQDLAAGARRSSVAAGLCYYTRLLLLLNLCDAQLYPRHRIFGMMSRG